MRTLKKNLPNFLIVGAAKAGTTSLHNYLSMHPDIFMSRPKEPKFFSFTAGITKFNGIGDDGVKYNIIKDFGSYHRIFDSSDNYKMRGESSADNLYYAADVIPLIKNFLGNNVKIIIVLRNPINRAFSAYKHLVRDGRENLSFGEALKAEDSRKAKGWEFLWFYKDVGLYSNQVEKYLENFANVKMFLFEDFSDNTKLVYEEILKFLEIDRIIIPDQIKKKYNVGYVPKNRFIHKLANNYDGILPYPLAKQFKTLVPRKFRMNIKNRINKINAELCILNAEIRNYLNDYFYQDIMRLESIVDKNCEKWLK